MTTSTTRPHRYAETVTGSNYAPFTLILKDVQRGGYVDLTGATVTINIFDETTGEQIVDNGVAAPNDVNPYWIEYYLTDIEAAKITQVSTWIGYWTLNAPNGRKYKVPTPCRIPVRPAPL